MNRAGLKQVGGAFNPQDFGVAKADQRAGEYYARGAQFGDPAIAAQRQQLQQLQRQAQGLGGPSIAETQLRSQAARNVSDGFAMAAMGRGGNQAGMQMAAMGQMAGAQADTNNQAAVMRMAEQQQAQAMAMQQAQQMAANQLGYEQLAQQALLGSRGQDIDYELGKGALDLNRQQFHTSRNMGWAKMGADTLGGLFQGLSAMSDERMKTGLEQLDGPGFDPSSYGGIGNMAAVNADPSYGVVIGSDATAPAPASGGGEDMAAKRRKAASEGIGEFRKRLREPDWYQPSYLPVGRHAVSDERAKMGLGPASAADATAEVASYKFGYKPEALSAGLGAPGTNFGVSAQQVEQTSLGPSLVREGPDGLKRIDAAQASTTALAATGENSRRIQELERALGVPRGGGVPQGHGSRPQQPMPRTSDPFAAPAQAAPQAAPGVDLDPRVPWSYSDRVRAKAAAELAGGAPPGFRGLERRQAAEQAVARRAAASHSPTFEQRAQVDREFGSPVDHGRQYAPPRTSTEAGSRRPVRPPSWEQLAARAQERPAPVLPAAPAQPQPLPTVERDLGPAPKGRAAKPTKVAQRGYWDSGTGARGQTQATPVGFVDSVARGVRRAQGAGAMAGAVERGPTDSDRIKQRVDWMNADAARASQEVAQEGKYLPPKPLTPAQQRAWDDFWDRNRDNPVWVESDERGGLLSEGGTRIQIPEPWDSRYADAWQQGHGMFPEARRFSEDEPVDESPPSSGRDERGRQVTLPGKKNKALDRRLREEADRNERETLRKTEREYADQRKRDEKELKESRLRGVQI